MGLLYEMVIKKRSSAFLLEERHGWKQSIKDAARERLPEQGIKHIKQQGQQTAGS
ncbi:hypothetical protein [Paenibacillus sp. FJAT-27812]|uniref:hypothetical protein n=1 Tax=Paenibacillus sp. FJAT-27812 TaxID=1684143 RepID=UPI000A78CDF3|nr:hypothetical protein [Paenibacillus sp. FJAT-27812]